MFPKSKKISAPTHGSVSKAVLLQRKIVKLTQSCFKQKIPEQVHLYKSANTVLKISETVWNQIVILKSLDNKYVHQH